MAKQSSLERFETWVEARIERAGLRPRDAAYVIASFWALAVVVFGVLQRIVFAEELKAVRAELERLRSRIDTYRSA